MVIRILLFLSILVLMGSDCERDRLNNLDNGKLVRDGYELEPYLQPWKLVVDETVDDPDFGFDRSQITEGIGWWNEQADRDGTDRTWFVEGDSTDVPDVAGVILIDVGYTGGTEDQPILGNHYFAYSEGFILYATITISSDITYDEDTVLAVLKHEMGHAMGLADDPGPPETVDLNSVMGSPLVLDGELTDHDFELLTAE